MADTKPHTPGWLRPELLGMWAPTDWRFAFVKGAKLAHFMTTGTTMFPAEVDICEREAERLYAELQSIRSEGTHGD